MVSSEQFCENLIKYLVENNIIEINNTTTEQLEVIIQEYIKSTK